MKATLKRNAETACRLGNKELYLNKNSLAKRTQNSANTQQNQTHQQLKTRTRTTRNSAKQSMNSVSWLGRKRNELSKEQQDSTGSRLGKNQNRLANKTGLRFDSVATQGLEASQQQQRNSDPKSTADTKHKPITQLLETEPSRIH